MVPSATNSFRALPSSSTLGHLDTSTLRALRAVYGVNMSHRAGHDLFMGGNSNKGKQPKGRGWLLLFSPSRAKGNRAGKGQRQASKGKGHGPCLALALAFTLSPLPLALPALAPPLPLPLAPCLACPLACLCLALPLVPLSPSRLLSPLPLPCRRQGKQPKGRGKARKAKRLLASFFFTKSGKRQEGREGAKASKGQRD
jgi:hypothetical protein